MASGFRYFAFLALVLVFVSTANAESFGPHFDYLVVTGIYPMLAFIVGALIYLLLWRAPWHHRAWSLLVLALSLLVTLILGIAGALSAFPCYAAPLTWLAPLAAWLSFNQWLRRNRAK